MSKEGHADPGGQLSRDLLLLGKTIKTKSKQLVKLLRRHCQPCLPELFLWQKSPS
jgi:hypothetical protein